ncbi:hypothetical protein BJY01DRAFT_234751 [Aspergillus pseudoustus]|uniref:FAD-binding domain-containing protein n=1 Tax=Aspergillus pseudoustus TaxID=1810923 RepID=A0ABR4K1H6_9EURO
MCLGLEGLFISKSCGIADTPTAHLFNPFAFEYLGDLGIEGQAVQQSVCGRASQSMRWSRSMIGEEYGKVLVGRAEHPLELEPLLVRYASHHNFNNLSRDSAQERYICTIGDNITRSTFQVCVQYLFGADGARSQGARLLDFQPDRTSFFGLVAHPPGFGPNGNDPFEGLIPQSPELIRDIIEDEPVDIEILRMDHWTVRETFSLGSNTYLEDSYHLAWKVVYPVGAMLVQGANNGLRAQMGVGWQLVGMFAANPEEGADKLAKLSHGQHIELHSWGAAYSQWYKSTAVYLVDENYGRPGLESNPILQVQVTTYKISTHDLAGKGTFFVCSPGSVVTVGKAQPLNIANSTGIPINVYGIGVSLGYSDVHRDWHDNRGVEEESGRVLVRPDRFVAWRSEKLVPDC